MFGDIGATFQNDLQILFQALIALVLGGTIGWEREVSGKWAGLRTHMLVCFAAMMLVQVGRILANWSGQVISGVDVRIDPLRLMEAIIAGVAFLGAGTVFRDPDQERMRGLTTAASLLTVAPIGVAVALERYVLAIGATLLVLFVLRIMNILEVRYIRSNPSSE